MKVFQLNSGFIPVHSGSIVLALGNFDGFHLGHQTLLHVAKEVASKVNAQSSLLSFDPHPSSFFQGAAKPLLYSPDLKQSYAMHFGVENYFLVSFDQLIANMSPELFFREILVEGIKAKHIVVGANFKFGHQRSGDVETLTRLGKKFGVGVHINHLKKYNDQVVSSSRIRDELQNSGKVSQITKMLGREYCLTSTVVLGQQVGTKIGFPTANLHIEKQVVPRPGVYCGRVCLEPNFGDIGLSSREEDSFACVINIGHRPTLNYSDKKIVEFHIYDSRFKNRHLYEKKVLLFFKRWIRTESIFASKNELVAAIKDDIEKAKEYERL